jgi:hypothetical protein
MGKKFRRSKAGEVLAWLLNWKLFLAEIISEITHDDTQAARSS